jgi:hypothetical protein
MEHKTRRMERKNWRSSASAAFQLKRRADKKGYRFRRVRNAGSGAAPTPQGAPASPARKKKKKKKATKKTKTTPKKNK